MKKRDEEEGRGGGGGRGVARRNASSINEEKTTKKKIHIFVRMFLNYQELVKREWEGEEVENSIFEA